MQDSSLGSIQIVIITLHVWKELHYYWIFSPPSGKWDRNCATVYSVENKHLFHRGFRGAANLPVLLQVIIKNYLGFVKVGWGKFAHEAHQRASKQCFFRQAPLYVTLSPAILSKLGQKNRKSAAKGPNWMGDCPSLHPHTIQLPRPSLAHCSFCFTVKKRTWTVGK